MDKTTLNANISQLNYILSDGINHPGEAQMLFIHGLGGCGGLWRDFIDALAPDSWCALDLPGHGDSRDHNVKHINDIYQPLSTFCKVYFSNSDTCPVAHSLGGLLLLHLLCDEPRLFRRAVLMSTDSQILLHPDMVEQIQSKRYDRAFFEAGFPHGTDKAITERVIAAFDDLDLRCDKTENFLSLSTFTTPDTDRINIPMLFLAGKEDKIISPRRTRKLSNQLADASLNIIDGIAHYPFLESPVEAADSIKAFLNGKDSYEHC